jgi:hypothetical protein
VNVADYGAEPDVEADQTAAIRDAFRAAATEGATVSFEAGEYWLQSDTYWRDDAPAPMDYHLLWLDGFDSLTIEGNGASLAAKGRMVDGRASFAKVLNVENVDTLEFRDLSIHWDRWMPHSAGTVVENTEGYFDLELNAPYTAREGLYAVSFLQFNDELRRPEEPLYNQHRWGEKQCSVQSENVLRVPKKPVNAKAKRGASEGPSLEEGWGALVRHANAGAMGIQTFSCGDVTLDGVTLHSIPGMAVNVFAADNLTVRNTQVAPRDVEGYWLSATRDGFHVGDVSGEILFENVVAENLGDDGVNFKVRRYTVDAVPDARTLVIRKLATPGWYEHLPLVAGDTVEVGADPNPYVADATPTLQNVEKGGEQNAGGGWNAVYTLTVDRDLPESVQNAEHISLINASRIAESVTMRDTRIGKLRGANRFSLDNTTIENCEIYDTTRFPVIPHVIEKAGRAMHDFTFRNNTIARSATHPAYDGGRRAVIWPRIVGPIQELTADFLTQYTFEENTFEDLPVGRSAIALHAMSDVTIDANDFSGITDAPPVFSRPPVDCDTVTIDGDTGCPE